MDPYHFGKLDPHHSEMSYLDPLLSEQTDPDSHQSEKPDSNTRRSENPGAVDSVADLGCLSRIPDPNCLHPRSRIRIKEFKYFNPKKPKAWFLSSRKYDPGCSSRIRMLTFYPSRIQGSKRHWIPDPDPQHWLWRLSC